MPRHGNLLICREPGVVEPTLEMMPGERRLWDNRFQVRLPHLANIRGQCTLGKLGLEGIASLRQVMTDGGEAMEVIPPPARPALPAFRDLDGLLAVPHLK